MINGKDVFVRNNIKTKYNKLKVFNPKYYYHEFENWNINFKSDIVVYNETRKLLIDAGLDKENIGTSNWNPFRDFINENDVVLIKPNMVRHKNPAFFGSLKSTITNYSLIRPILDYTIMALNGTGKIIIADAPVQECDFQLLLKKSKIGYMLNQYFIHYPNIELYDLRKNQNSNINTISIDLGKKSAFYENDNKLKKYSITNYSDTIMKKNHHKNHHEYISSDIVLKSDVIINLFKPKCHRIAGVTASMKNLIGIISKKECLPHFTLGDVNSNGDEYPKLTPYRKFCYRIFGSKNKIMYPFKLMLKVFNQLLPTASIVNGCWYKNDTIWRSITDVNYIADYSDKDGMVDFKKKKRCIFNVGDMIIAGEKNGPLHPNDKYVGCLIAGFNRNTIDNTICDMMGFKKKYIKYIHNEKYFIYVNGKKNNTIKNYNFKPADGWNNIKKGKTKF